jgi:hypothetical protein
MNIKICKSCPEFPDHFAKFVGTKNNVYTFLGLDMAGNLTNCRFNLKKTREISSYRYIKNKDLYYKTDILTIGYIPRCPYLFEHEVIDSD